MNPNDLDALDESVPLTKPTLDNIMGYQSEWQDYKHYFDCFLQAQNAKPTTCEADKLETNSNILNWMANFQHSLQAPFAKDIPIVQQYWARKKEAIIKKNSVSQPSPITSSRKKN